MYTHVIVAKGLKCRIPALRQAWRNVRLKRDCTARVRPQDNPKVRLFASPVFAASENSTFTAIQNATVSACRMWSTWAAAVTKSSRKRGTDVRTGNQGVLKSELSRRSGINRATTHHRVETGQLDRDLSSGLRGHAPGPPVALPPGLASRSASELDERVMLKNYILRSVRRISSI